MSMTSTQNLHYAIGELAFAVAFSDGEVQKEEREKFESIVSAELRTKHYDFDISDIIFKILLKERVDAETAYEWAMNQIKMNGHYLSPDLKHASLNIMEKIAKAFPPVTGEERDLIERFKKDIEPIVGDPVYYSGKVR